MNSMKKKLEAIFGIIFLMWFFASMFLMLYYGKMHETYKVLLLFGQYFLIFGICIMFAKDWHGSIFSIVGLAIIIISFLVYHPNIVKFDWKVVLIMAIIIGLILIGLFMVFFTIIKLLKKRKRCSSKVEAKIIKVNKSYSDGVRVFAPVYHYYINDSLITHESNNYTNYKVPKVGDTIKLYVNPDNPHEIDTRIMLFNIITVLIGIVLVYFGIKLLLLYLTQS